MEFLDTTDFSDQQMIIIAMRIENKPLQYIQQHFNDGDNGSSSPLSRNAVITCLTKSALAQNWYKGMKGGTDKYLSVPDFEKLKETVIVNAREDNHLDAQDIIAEAFKLKKQRVALGVKFFIATNSPALAYNLDTEIIKPPVRS